MKASYHINAKERLIVYTMAGTLTTNGILEVLHAAITDPGWSSEFDMMCLFRNADFSVFTVEESKHLSNAIQALDGTQDEAVPIRAALVCSDELARPLLTYWEATGRAERRAIDRVFATESEARAWLAGPR